MRLRQSKIIASLLLCLSPVISWCAQATPPPPVPPPPPGLPIDDYIPFMIIVALTLGVFYFRKVRFQKKA